MFAWTSHGTELKRFSRQPITRAAIAVMLLIPLLYGAMYVWAFWDPTTHLNELPVALVNNDKPGADKDGVRHAYGQEVVDELLDRNDIGWVAVNSQTARSGVTSGKYYFSVTIPADFTAKVNSLGGSHPQAAQIDVTYDDTNSFLASTLGKSAMNEVQQAIRDKISKRAADSALVGLNDARDGFGTASDGAFTLSDGLGRAVSGADSLSTGAGKLARGAAALDTGTQSLATGADQLHQGLGAYQAGAATAGAGAHQLNAGAAQLSALQGGLAQAADPHNGAPALAAGINQLGGSLTTLQSGVSQFAGGASQFATGSGGWLSGAESWRAQAYQATGGDLIKTTQSIADGAGSLASSTASDSSLGKNAQSLKTGNASLAHNLDDLDARLAAANKLIDTDPAAAKKALADIQTDLAAQKADASGLVDRADHVSDGISAVHQNALTLQGAANALNGAWSQMHAALAPDSALGKALAQLDQGQRQLAAGSTNLDAGAHQLADPTTTAQLTALTSGANKLSAGITSMSAAASNPQTGIPALQAGAAQLDAAFNNPDPKGGLVSGAAALNAGAGNLATGAQAAHNGASQLNDGATRLSGATPQLVVGLKEAAGGASTLGTKLDEGATAIPADSATQRTDRAQAMSSPVQLSAQHIWQADSWGEGFAPFFISLALWVGALITWLLLRPLQTRALLTSVNGFRMAWGSLNSALLLSVGQVAIMLSVMHFAIGLNPKNVLATVAFTLLAAGAFFALQQFFQVTLGSAVGKVVIIVLLMIQLASAGGTYPIQTTPSFLQAISDYLPMTYVVSGLREAITGGIETRFWVSAAVLLAIFVVSLAATSIVSARKRVWTMSRLHPALSI